MRGKCGLRQVVVRDRAVLYNRRFTGRRERGSSWVIRGQYGVTGA